MSIKLFALTKTRQVLRFAISKTRKKHPEYSRSLTELYDFIGIKWYNSLYKGGTFGADLTGTGVSINDIRRDHEKYVPKITEEEIYRLYGPPTERLGGVTTEQIAQQNAIHRRFNK